MKELPQPLHVFVYGCLAECLLPRSFYRHALVSRAGELRRRKPLAGGTLSEAYLCALPPINHTEFVSGPERADNKEKHT